MSAADGRSPSVTDMLTVLHSREGYPLRRSPCVASGVIIRPSGPIIVETTELDAGKEAWRGSTAVLGRTGVPSASSFISSQRCPVVCVTAAENYELQKIEGGASPVPTSTPSQP
jgi:hypothetical protein